MDKIKIKKSSTADTRTCNWSEVTKDQLRESSESHIRDVRAGLKMFADMLMAAADTHDYDKLSDLDTFYSDFKTGFESTIWWDFHKKLNRHHINVEDGVREDVDLVDVIEHIVDCVMAGLARSGTVYPVELNNNILQAAVRNTFELLKAEIEVVDEVAPGLSESEHIARHKALRAGLDELVADWITETNGLPSKATIMDLITWSYEQTKKGDNNDTE